MTLHEFDLIKQFFASSTLSRRDVILGIGDDAAILTIPSEHELVISTDTLISGVHFPIETSAFDIAHKALAVNLSDLAAMGATPAWATLALTIPEANKAWLTEFSAGFFALANRFNVQLIGGDTTRGPLSITIAAHGIIPTGSALRRDRAKPNDLIYVTNTLGEAGFALQQYQKQISPNPFLQKLNQPEPQIMIGEKLRGIAHAAIDISDGLAADLGHILENSLVGANVIVDDLPLSKTLRQFVSQEEGIHLALTAGDDYELCFTIPENKKSQLETTLKDFSYTCIGKITETPGLNFTFRNGDNYVQKTNGYQHF